MMLFDNYNQMSFLQRNQVRYALGIAGASAFIFGLYRLWKFICSNSTPKLSKEEETQSNKAKQSESQNDEEHIPYDENIEDKHLDKMGVGHTACRIDLKDISYKIILCLMKGSSYQGIVIITFQLEMLREDQDFKINYNGVGVKLLMANGVRIDPRDVKYIDHFIIIPKQVLRERSKNSIQIIFQSSYSFLNEGLSAYFMVDENYKYSMRQQVIYSSNGYLEIQKIIPCINCLNECKVQVEAVHPNTFQVFSNSSKSLERFCSITQYQKYPFLFDLSSNSLNRSFKLNTSTASSGSGMGESNSSQYSASNFNNRKKANTHFYEAKLPSIHNFFVFSSSMVELVPTPTRGKVQESIMLRYFCKPSQSHRFSRVINKLHTYILDTIRRISPEEPQKCGHKIDVLIISDKASEGNFTPGVIMLAESSLADNLDIRCLYLIVRALLGMHQLGLGQNVVTLAQILALNELVFSKFEEFRNYLYIKNQKYEEIRNIIAFKDKQEYLSANEGFFVRYYCKELRFILRNNINQNISFQFSTLMQSFKADTLQEFWQNFLSNYNFLSPLIIEPLLKLAIRKYGAPSDQRLREQLKVCFNSSKYAISFYTNQQLSDNLPKFLQYEAFGLEERLTQLKVKQKFKDFITQKYEKYLPVKSNMQEAEVIYNQFKKFNQSKNFHHCTLLKSEIKRVQCFGANFIKPERVGLQCSVSAWKLLHKLKIYPSDEDYYRFLRTIDTIQQL